MAFIGLAKLFFGGDTETFFIIVSPALGAAVSYFGRHLNPIVNDLTGGYRRRRAIEAGVRDRAVLLKAICDQLRKQRDQPGVSRKRKQEINEEIAEMERLFAAGLKEQLLK